MGKGCAAAARFSSRHMNSAIALKKNSRVFK